MFFFLSLSFFLSFVSLFFFLFDCFVDIAVDGINGFSLIYDKSTKAIIIT